LPEEAITYRGADDRLHEAYKMELDLIQPIANA